MRNLYQQYRQKSTQSSPAALHSIYDKINYSKIVMLIECCRIIDIYEQIILPF